MSLILDKIYYLWYYVLSGESTPSVPTHNYQREGIIWQNYILSMGLQIAEKV